MAVNRGATISDRKISSNSTEADITHTVDVGTTLLLVYIGTEGGEAISGTPSWSLGGGEDLTLIRTFGASSNAADCIGHLYGLINPTDGAGTVSVAFTSNCNPAWAAAVNYLDTETASVGAATAFLSEDINDAGTATAVHASAGNAGNALFFGGHFQGADGSPASNATSFTEVFDTTTGGSNNADFSCYIGELLDAAPEAITVTWNGITDENTSVFIEIIAPAGGTLNFETVTGALTPTGDVVIKDTVKNVAGAVTPTGDVSIKDTLKALAGALTPTGDITIKDIVKFVAGVVTPTGVVAGVKTVLKSISGAVAPAGALIRDTFTSVAGALTPTGALIKDTLKNVAGAVTPVGTMIRDILKLVAGVVTPTGVVAGVKTVLKSISGAVAPVGTLIKDTATSVAGALTPTGALIKEALKSVAGAVTPVGTMIRDILKLVAGAVTPNAILGRVKTFVQDVGGAVAPAGALVKETLKGVAGSVTPVGVIVRDIFKNVAGVVTPVGTLIKDIILSATKLIGAVTPTGALGRLFIPDGGGGPISRIYRRYVALANAAHPHRPGYRQE